MSQVGKLSHSSRIYIKNRITDNKALKLSTKIINTFEYAPLTTVQAKSLVSIATRLQKRLNRGELTQEKFVEYKNVLVESEIPFNTALKYLKYLFVAGVHQNHSEGGTKLNFFNFTNMTKTISTIIDGLERRVKNNSPGEINLPAGIPILTAQDDEEIDEQLASVFKETKVGPLEVYKEFFLKLQIKSDAELQSQPDDIILNVFKHCIAVRENTNNISNNLNFAKRILKNLSQSAENLVFQFCRTKLFKLAQSNNDNINKELVECMVIGFAHLLSQNDVDELFAIVTKKFPLAQNNANNKPNFNPTFATVLVEHLSLKISHQKIMEIFEMIFLSIDNTLFLSQKNSSLEAFHKVVLQSPRLKDSDIQSQFDKFLFFSKVRVSMNFIVFIHQVVKFRPSAFNIKQITELFKIEERIVFNMAIHYRVPAIKMASLLLDAYKEKIDSEIFARYAWSLAEDFHFEAVFCILKKMKGIFSSDQRSSIIQRVITSGETSSAILNFFSEFDSHKSRSLYILEKQFETYMEELNWSEFKEISLLIFGLLNIRLLAGTDKIYYAENIFFAQTNKIDFAEKNIFPKYISDANADEIKELCTLLLEKKQKIPKKFLEKINAYDKFAGGHTTLMLAIEQDYFENDFEVNKAIKAAGAGLTEVNDEGKSVLDFAKKSRHAAILVPLIENKSKEYANDVDEILEKEQFLGAAVLDSLVTDYVSVVPRTSQSPKFEQKPEQKEED